MNNDSRLQEMRITEYPICQFNIVLGEHGRSFRSTKKNKYFVVGGNEDLKLVQYAVNSEYKKKKKEGYAVAGEIIFLIPDDSYRDLAMDMMDKLNFRGSVQVVPPIKTEVPHVDSKVEEVKREEEVETPQEEHIESVSDVKEEEKNEQTIIEKEDTFEVKKVSSVKQATAIEDSSVLKEEEKKQASDMVFHGDFEVPHHTTISTKKKEISKKSEKDEDVSSYMWGDSTSEQLVSKKKSRIDLPVIIFIVSFIFLVGAVILLFVLK